MSQITLNSLKKNTPKPPIISIYGDAGIGKSTFATQAPNPVVIRTEDGLGDLDVMAFPVATTTQEVREAITSLQTTDHEFKTLVLDSVDWLEAIIFEEVAKKANVAEVSLIDYGKGYGESRAIMRDILLSLIKLRDTKGMIIIIVAHSHIKRVEDPDLPSYDSHDIKLHKSSAALIHEFSDIILYACFDTFIKTEKEGFKKRGRAFDTGERIVRTVGTPAYTAKNRFSLPPVLPLNWSKFMTAFTNRK